MEIISAVVAATFCQGELKSDPDTLRKFGLPNITNRPLATRECCLSADGCLGDGDTHFALDYAILSVEIKAKRNESRSTKNKNAVCVTIMCDNKYVKGRYA